MSPAGDDDPDAALAALGATLAAMVTAAVPGWVVRCVEGLLPVDAVDRPAVMARAEEAGSRAGVEVGDRLAALLVADVDLQHDTPLQVVRRGIVYPTAVLARAGVAPIERGRFEAERFPDDPYGLTPASLGALDPSLAEPALAWGAAKAYAHRRRHATDPG